MNLLITGGAGFIGTNFLKIVKKKRGRKLMIVMDSLTYAANYDELKQDVYDHPKIKFTNVDIRDARYVEATFEKYGITHVMNLATEAYVGDSLSFIETNVLGTANLLNASKKYGVERFHHVSTASVFGGQEDKKKEKFTEITPYNPIKPYSASKASADHLVQSYHHAYELPVTVSYCSSNYGPWQSEEKLIPKVITSIFERKKIPIYGEGLNVRDWLYVEDHCEALWSILTKGKIGESYMISSNCEKRNLDVVNDICDLLKVDPSDCLDFVCDKEGHSFRYSLSSTKIQKELRWKPRVSFEKGIARTITHYKNKYDTEFRDL